MARLGNYEPLFELASGGMATVYVARQVGAAGFERLVVIKRVHPHLVKNREFTDMFRDEARVCATIRHPNVVPVIDVVEADGELFLVLEYVESMPLSALVKERLAPPIVVRIVSDVLAGLHAAHEAVDMRGNKIELIHRDVSPHNVIVGVDGASRLIDFGIAKAASRVSVTNSGVVKGKLRYMSPEQVRQKPLDRRADVFAAGVVLYEALTGELPFPGEDEGDVVVSLLIGDPPPVSSRVPGLPPELDLVIQKALAREREDRFSTAAAFQEALDRALPPAAPRDVAALVASIGGEELARRREQLKVGLEAPAEIARSAPALRAKAKKRARAIGVVAGCTIVVAIGAAALLLRSRARAAASTPAPSASAAAAPELASPSLVPSAPSATATPPRGPRKPARPPPSSDLHRRNPYGAP